MTIYILKEIISTKYNRSDEERFNRSIAFVIQNTINGNLALFQLDRIAKKVAALRCNNRSCGAKTSDRQAKIKQCLESISFMDIKSELLGLSQLLNDIGVANPSEFTLEQIPSDFLYLSKIFD